MVAQRYVSPNAVTVYHGNILPYEFKFYCHSSDTFSHINGLFYDELPRDNNLCEIVPPEAILLLLLQNIIMGHEIMSESDIFLYDTCSLKKK